MSVFDSVFFRLVVGALLFWGATPRTFCAEAPTNSILRLRFLTNSAGETMVRKGESNALLNVSRAAENKGTTYSLIPETSTVALSSEQFPGWGAELPPQQTVSFGFDYARRILLLSTAAANTNLVRLNFPDGASAQMDSNADGRLEFLDDGTYAFFGSGAMTGTNADGAPVRFGHVFPPLLGGQLIAPTSTNPNARFVRTSPITQVTLLGQIDKGLSAKVGDQVVPLDGGAAKEIKTASGAVIQMQRNPETRSIDWTVKRGLFRINVDTFRCWKALATSGQSASMQWDTNGFLIELKNKNGSGAFQKTVLVNLNSSLNVSVGAHASFQYGRVGDCSTFVAAASGGETTMYNALNDRSVRLDSGNMNIVSGWPDSQRSEAPAAGRVQIRLGWTSDNKIELRSAENKMTVNLNEENTFSAAAAELHVAYSGNDKLSLRSDAGSISVVPDFMSNVSIELNEGAEVTVGYDRSSDLFQVTAGQGTTPAGLRTISGYIPALPPGSPLTFVINRSNFNSSEAAGMLVFGEIAGAGSIGSSGSDSISVRTLPTGRGDSSILSATAQGLDVSRITQPPATSSE